MDVARPGWVSQTGAEVCALTFALMETEVSKIERGWRQWLDKMSGALAGSVAGMLYYWQTDAYRNAHASHV